MDNQSFQKLRDFITKSNSIGIAVAPNPSLDKMAAALSLALLLKEVNKNAIVACPTDPIVEISNLVGINKVQKSFGGNAAGVSGNDMVVAFPYLEGEIEKVSYTLENGFLNIIVKASEQGLSFSEKDVQFTRGGGEAAPGGNIELLFVIGAQSLADIGNLYDQQKMQNTNIINIDNSDKNQGYGTLQMVIPQASSLCELIGDIALSLGFKVERDAAQNLMSGLTVATQNFQNPRTSSLAFEVASYAMKRGAARLAPRPQPQDDFAAQFLNRPAPAQQQPMPKPQPVAQPQLQQQQPRFQQQQQPMPQQQPVTSQQSAQSREDQLRQQLREQEAQQNARPQQPDEPQDDAAPVDWLTPKVYKGSSNF